MSIHKLDSSNGEKSPVINEGYYGWNDQPEEAIHPMGETNFYYKYYFLKK